MFALKVKVDIKVVQLCKMGGVIPLVPYVIFVILLTPAPHVVHVTQKVDIKVVQLCGMGGVLPLVQDDST